MKYVLTTSDDNHVIIAEVDDRYRKQKPNEFFLSAGCLQANLQAGKFTDISDKVDYENRVWMLTEDMA
jgi:hypothetical protein